MNVRVRLFAAAGQKVGCDAVELTLAESSSVGQLREALVARFPDLAPLAPHLLFTLDRQYSSDDVPLRSDAEVACFPPVSGG